MATSPRLRYRHVTKHGIDSRNRSHGHPTIPVETRRESGRTIYGIDRALFPWEVCLSKRSSIAAWSPSCACRTSARNPWEFMRPIMETREAKMRGKNSKCLSPTQLGDEPESPDAVPGPLQQAWSLTLPALIAAAEPGQKQGDFERPPLRRLPPASCPRPEPRW